MDLEKCNWTNVETDQGVVIFAFWTEYPVMKYQKVQWLASGGRYVVDGYFN